MTDLRSRIRSGETLIGVFSDLASPIAVELCGRAGFDWCVIDLEHGAATEAELLALLYAVGSTPMTPIVRVQSAERLRVGRALDLGAAGVMLPQLQSLDEVKEVVRYLRYPPVGSRGVALRTRGADMGALGHADVVRVVNERIVGIVQIEAPGTVADADAIAALDEVDVLFVGPADLSHNLGVPGRFDEPVYQDAIRNVVAACGRHGKAAGILIYDAAGLPPLLELGFRFVGVGSEGSFVSSGARAVLAAAGRAASA
ncbi:MAG TPA: aldolase/citrate lyase family protein [Candidatus Limnocylindrales bacterium]|jgi:2-dehydro-3-deoxyglucarate aldolase/4-hydroxy-2-oxoheptanedioate aldolase|nr:aldolase/citrate lyase family protein [Candidatus Limnocylindrales bacterium]